MKPIFDHKKYPILGYRVAPSQKKRLDKKIETLTKLLNKTKTESDRPFRKKDAFTLALEVGIERIAEVEKRL